MEEKFPDAAITHYCKAFLHATLPLYNDWCEYVENGDYRRLAESLNGTSTYYNFDAPLEPAAGDKCNVFTSSTVFD